MTSLAIPFLSGNAGSFILSPFFGERIVKITRPDPFFLSSLGGQRFASTFSFPFFFISTRGRKRFELGYFSFFFAGTMAVFPLSPFFHSFFVLFSLRERGGLAFFWPCSGLPFVSPPFSPVGRRGGASRNELSPVSAFLFFQFREVPPFSSFSLFFPLVGRKQRARCAPALFLFLF